MLPEQEIEDIIGNQNGTVFVTQIQNHNVNTLFDTGATKSVMSGDMYSELQNQMLETTGLPKVVGASGSSLGVLGRTTCELSINGITVKQDFLVCEHLKRHLILGIDFARKNGPRPILSTKQTQYVHGPTICRPLY